jgi:hypothetical protein
LVPNKFPNESENQSRKYAGAAALGVDACSTFCNLAFGIRDSPFAINRNSHSAFGIDAIRHSAFAIRH